MVPCGPCSEELIQRCDAGELQPPGFSWISSFQARSDLQIGARRRAMDIGERNPKTFLSSSLFQQEGIYTLHFFQTGRPGLKPNHQICSRVSLKYSIARMISHMLH
ncbi:zinc finger protein 90 homolog isoform X4 [Castor canadensis]|uniref:Zinc finger protein 90 homolog isoform X4 n=1 Tax=Castor canadensis TaxID=51338 RepID=A0AC58L3Z5_CASCN